MGYFLVMLLILELIVYLTLKLIVSWRPVRSHSMKPYLVQLLSFSVQVRMSLVKAFWWRRSRKMPIGVISS